MKATIKQREHYTFFLPIQTRWADNDLYGHVNNVTYYSYFDTASNALLIQENKTQSERIVLLNRLARQQLITLTNTKSAKKLNELQNNAIENNEIKLQVKPEGDKNA